MKWTLVVYIAAIYVAGNAPTLLGANLLTNSGFESGALSPWFQDHVFGGGEDWNVTTADAHSGLYSATNTGNKEIRENFSPVPVQNITSISFWAKHVGNGDAFGDLCPSNYSSAMERTGTGFIRCNEQYVAVIRCDCPSGVAGRTGVEGDGIQRLRE